MPNVPHLVNYNIEIHALAVPYHYAKISQMSLQDERRALGDSDLLVLMKAGRLICMAMYLDLKQKFI